VSLKTRLSPEVLEVLKNEINVLEIGINPKQREEIIIDWEITPELKEIGILNDFVRFVQDLRQEAGLMPKEFVSLKISGGKMLMNILRKRMKDLEKRAKTHISYLRRSTLIAEKEFNYENFGKVKIELFK